MSPNRGIGRHSVVGPLSRGYGKCMHITENKILHIIEIDNRYITHIMGMTDGRHNIYNIIIINAGVPKAMKISQPNWLPDHFFCSQISYSIATDILHKI